ncbi:protein mono-ADP-ribosyltransferase PARP10 [Menidia menidia]
MPVESPEDRTVEVLALPDGIDEELLYLYFENKRRSGGGSLEAVEKKDNNAVLVFEEAEAAARVLAKGHHVLHNVELTVRKPLSKDPCRLLLRGLNPSTNMEMVELYVENMMGLSITDYTLHRSPGKDCVLIHLSQALSKEFQMLQVKISKRKLDGAEVTIEQIEQTDSVLVENLHPGTTADLLSLYFESNRGGHQKVKEVAMLSEGTARVSFENSESLDPILNRQHKLDGSELIVKAYFDFLQPAKSEPAQDSVTESQGSPENSSEALTDVVMQAGPVLMDADQPSHPSSQAAVETPAIEIAEEVAEEAMEDQAEEDQMLSCKVLITDPVKSALFQCSAFYQDTQKAYPNFSIQMKDGEGVDISGPDRLQVEQLKQRILEFIGQLVETNIPLEPEQAEFLARPDVKEQLHEAMSQTASPAMYTVSNSDVTVTSSSQDSARRACDFLKSQLSSFRIPVDGELQCMLFLREWTEFLQALGFVYAKRSEQEDSIDVLTLKGMEDEKQTAILKFLSTPIERETLISMDSGTLKYIQIHSHQLLADMDQVSIFPLEGEEVSGLKIHGHAVACQMAEELLQGVVSSICTRTITINNPGVARFLDEKECRSIFNEMETKFQVLIILKYEVWQPLPDQDIFESAWKMMSHRNFQKVSVNGSAQELKSDSEQMVPNGASGGGLLEEAKKIVSAIDDREPEEGLTAGELDDMDDMDLYTAEEPAPLKDGDSNGSAAEASQLPADQNAAGGSFASNLEEEAQLSLAIQYSLESSQWSLIDEEEQFQKALELSKSMIQNEHCSGGVDRSSRTEPKKKGCGNASLQETIKAANTVQLEVFAGYDSDLVRVDIAFNKKVSLRQVDEKLEHRCISKMSDYHWKCLEMIQRKHAVELQVQGTIVAVSGFQDYVAGAVADIKLLLDKISNSLTDEEILKTVRWEQHEPASLKPTAYSPDAIVFIENSWRMKLKKVDILLDNQPHIIDFEKMEEYNIASGKAVTISRTLPELVDLTKDLPEEECSLLSNLPEASKVDEESDEFQNVVKSFYETIQDYHSRIRIIKVEKLMNRLLYNQYKLKKLSVMQRSSHPEIERTLYHGTSETSVKEICVHGFNRSFCGKNATVYGQGVYFAVNSALSVQEQYSPPNADGYKFIFMSKVLTGDFTKGCHAMKTAPLKETGDIPLRYDSVTDDITKPTMFVIFNDTQAFPEYLITCQRIHR